MSNRMGRNGGYKGLDSTKSPDIRKWKSKEERGGKRLSALFYSDC